MTQEEWNKLFVWSCLRNLQQENFFIKVMFPLFRTPRVKGIHWSLSCVPLVLQSDTNIKGKGKQKAETSALAFMIFPYDSKGKFRLCMSNRKNLCAHRHLSLRWSKNLYYWIAAGFMTGSRSAFQSLETTRGYSKGGQKTPQMLCLTLRICRQALLQRDNHVDSVACTQ